MPKRCSWCGTDALYVAYHDEEWGVPLHNDRELFAMLILEGAQAGLSWLTVLRKRENYYRAFDNFAFESIARYGQKDIDRLLQDSGIVRNRLKIESAIKNARGAVTIRDRFGSLDAFFWNLIDYTPIQNQWQDVSEIPVQTPESDLLSKELKRYGMNFVGSTICYAFMQAVGMVNDHIVDCFRHRPVKALSHHQ